MVAADDVIVASAINVPAAVAMLARKAGKANKRGGHSGWVKAGYSSDLTFLAHKHFARPCCGHGRRGSASLRPYMKSPRRSFLLVG
jgi:hypothetical protein